MKPSLISVSKVRICILFIFLVQGQMAMALNQHIVVTQYANPAVSSTGDSFGRVKFMPFLIGFAYLLLTSCQSPKINKGLTVEQVGSGGYRSYVLPGGSSAVIAERGVLVDKNLLILKSNLSSKDSSGGPSTLIRMIQINNENWRFIGENNDSSLQLSEDEQIVLQDFRQDILKNVFVDLPLAFKQDDATLSSRKYKDGNQEIILVKKRNEKSRIFHEDDMDRTKAQTIEILTLDKNSETGKVEKAAFYLFLIDHRESYLDAPEKIEYFNNLTVIKFTNTENKPQNGLNIEVSEEDLTGQGATGVVEVELFRKVKGIF